MASKRINGPGVVFRYEGELQRVIAIAEGRSIVFESLEKDPCPCCNRPYRVELLEHSPLFQDGAEPVETLKVPQDGGQE